MRRFPLRWNAPRGSRLVAAVFILVLSAALGLKAASLAGAAGLNFEVNSTADALDVRVGDGVCRTSEGTCTLRAAIQEANAIPGGDTILVPGGTYELAIPPLNQNDVTTGDLDITDSLAITGAGAGATIVDGGTPKAGSPPRVHGLDRLFEVLADDGAVTFSGVTFSDGYAAEYGAAIMNSSTATITVTAATLTGNVADKAGGAIDNHLGGAVHLRDSTLVNNVAFESGSALNNNRDGTLTVTNSVISSNTAADVGLDESVLGAGAISNNAELDAIGTITVTGSQIGDNTAGGSRSGAAISNDGAGTVTVDQTVFSKNRAEVDGGAIFNGAGEVGVARSTFSENAGANGGAIFNSAKDGRMTVSDSTFSLNTAAARGGAIANGGTGSLTVIDSTFSKNSAEGWGGAVVNDDKGSVAILNSAFRENSGLNGGGFGNEGDGLVSVENSTFTKNTAFVTSVLAGGEGGGMQTNSGGPVAITGGAFTENSARDGGGFGTEGGGQVTITGTRFSGNRADEKGGGILIQSGTVRMLDIDVVGNVADAAIEAGGGIAYEGDKLVSVGEAAAIEDSRIRDNKAKGQGGGIDSRGDGPLDIVTTSIIGNVAGMGGGIHHVGDAPLEVTRSTLSGNFAESGGGLFTDGDGETTVENATISSNRAGQFGGGLLVSSRLNVRSSTVAGNNAASGGGINNGGGDLVGDGTVFLRNTIVANSPTGGNCMGTMTSLGGNIDSGNTCQFRDLSDQPGTDPRLGPLADNGGSTQTHALLAESPAQERALCAELDPCPPVDQRGVSRPIFSASDIGAYESELIPGGGGGNQLCSGRSERPVLSDFDSWVSESVPGANFGSDSILKVKSLATANQRSLIHFTLPSAPPGCKLVGATLRLYSSAATEGRTLKALRIAADWSEFGVTWANQPEAAGSAATTQSGREHREWNVLEQTRDLYGLGGHGFLIRDAAEGDSGEQSFHSSEKGIDRPPELILVFDDPNALPPPDVCPTTPQSVAADADSWVNEGSPLNNFGNESTLKVKSQLGYDARTLVRFPLPPLPPACTSIASATLRLDAQSAKPDRVLEAVQVASPWSETDVTWANQPATTGSAVTIPSGEGTLEWTLTAQVLDMYVGANHGFLIRDAEEDGVGDEQTFNGRLKLNDGPPELVLVFDDSTPETTIDSGPISPTSDTEASFAFSSDRDDASFQCSLDGAEFSACGAGHAVSGLTAGRHRLDVRATRPVRAVDPTPAAYEWTVDVAAPDAAIEVGPLDPTNETSAVLSFTGSDDVDNASELRFECRLDYTASDWADCTSPADYRELGEGRYSFHVRAIDRAGNVGVPAAHGWTVDLTPPETAIDAGPHDPSNSPSAAFAFSASEESTFACSLDGGPFEPCAERYEGLAEGAHTLAARAVDRAGNADAQPAVFRWTIDLTLPETSIDSGPADPTNATSATLTFSSVDGIRFECRLDGTDFGPCASPQDFAGLAEGGHDFEVRAIDAAGNIDPVPARYSWTIDFTVPATTIDGGPADPTNRTEASFAFAASEAARFECRLDDGTFAACESPARYDTLAEGAHRFEARAIDRAGNVGEPAVRDWTIDLTAPETSIDSAPVDPSKSPSAEFAFSADEEATFECSLDGGEFAPCPRSQTYEGLGEGGHRVEVRAVDKAGNVDETPAAHGWTIDLTPPTTSIGARPDDPTNETPASFEFAADEAATFECRLDGSPFEPCASPQSYEGLAEGTHAFDVRAIDRAGNVEPQPVRAVWRVDLTPPTSSIDTQPPDPTASVAARLEFSANEAASFECRLDGGLFGPCVSPAGYDGLTEGRHSFEVRATDRAGNLEPGSARAEWTVDLTAPETAIDSGPRDPSNSSSAAFVFAADEDARFECALDGGAFSPCAERYEGLAEGLHVLEARAVDRAGNVDLQPAVHRWTIDLTSPDTAIAAQPAARTSSTSATLEFSADEAATFECSLDDETFAVCTSPQRYAGLAEGAHTFDVRAFDRAGNVDPVPARVVWTIDLTPPDTSIDVQPSDPTSSSSATFAFSAGEDAAFACSLDGASFAACWSPESYDGLGDGRHTFEVHAVDAAGNVESSPASYSWTVDQTAPETTITAAPADPTNQTSARFDFASDESGSTFACSLDGGPLTPCDSPADYSLLEPGSHSFNVRATDAAGNTDATTASRTWTIDVAAPDTEIDAQPADPTNSTAASFSFSSEPGARFKCRVDGEAFAACTSPQSYAGLAEGRRTFDVHAVDAAGNVDPSPARYSWTVDTTPPETTIDSGPADPTNSVAATFRFSAAEPGAALECSLDGSPFAPCGSPREYDALAAGTHEFRVRASDAAGNADPTPASHVWVIDTSPPDTAVTGGPADPTNEDTTTFAFGGSDDRTPESQLRFQCRLDGAGDWLDCSSPWLYLWLPEGEHAFDVRAVDLAESSDPTPASYTWTIDRTAPEATIDSGPSATTSSTSASLTFSASEPGSSFECSLDDAPFAACTSPSDYEALGLGRHEFSVRAIDRAENTGSPATHVWTIEPPPDMTAPETTITDAPPALTRSTSASFSFSASKPGSTFECSLDGGVFVACASPQPYAGLVDGTHQFGVRAIDGAGNVDETPATATWTVDTLAPETTISVGPPATTASTSASFTFEASETGSTFECSLDGGTFSACGSPRSYTSLAEGSHQFRVRARDAAGNLGATPAVHTWAVDTVAPETTITSAPASPTTSTSASFSFTASETGSTFECSLDGAAFASCASPRQYSGLPAGSHHQFRVRATDRAGNTDGSPASHSWTITAACASQTLSAAADAWIDENSATSNKGDDSILKVQSKGPRDNFRALVRFALPPLPPGCAVDTATLRLYAASAKPGRVLEALQLASAWGENAVTWSNQPATTGAAAATTSGFGYREWDVSSQVRAMVAEGVNHGFLVRDAVESGDAEQQFHSREKGESAPQLVMRFAPGD